MYLRSFLAFDMIFRIKGGDLPAYYNSRCRKAWL